MRIFSKDRPEPEPPAGVKKMSRDDQMQYLIYSLATRGKRFYKAENEGLNMSQIVYGAYGGIEADIQECPQFIPKAFIFGLHKNTSRLHDIVHGRDRHIRTKQVRKYCDWRDCFDDKSDIEHIKECDTLNLLG